MSMELAAWIVFVSYLLLGLSTYYASQAPASLATTLPLVFTWVVKTGALIWFAIYFQLWAFIGIAMIDVIAIILGTATMNKEIKK